jgi:serine/threonine protein kinase
MVSLSFMHTRFDTIRHKDIKPQDILIHQDRIIYTDFRIAFDGTQNGNTTTTRKLDAFTRRYCAPEVANWTKRNRKSDIFSLGCVFIEIMAVLEPLLCFEQGESSAYCEIIGDLRSHLNYNGTISPQWTKLVRICMNMLEPDPDHRIGAEILRTALKVQEESRVDDPVKYFCSSCSRAPELATAEQHRG